jgi:hypothetical protein
LSISGSQCTLYTTVDSIPLLGVTVLSGAQLIYNNDAYGLQYTCGNNAKWAVPHTMSLQSAIDRIASVVGNITPIP